MIQTGIYVQNFKQLNKERHGYSQRKESKCFRRLVGLKDSNVSNDVTQIGKI